MSHVGETIFEGQLDQTIASIFQDALYFTNAFGSLPLVSVLNHAVREDMGERFASKRQGGQIGNNHIPFDVVRFHHTPSRLHGFELHINADGYIARTSRRDHPSAPPTANVQR